MKQFYTMPEITMIKIMQTDDLNASGGNGENSETIGGLLAGESNPFS